MPCEAVTTAVLCDGNTGESLKSFARTIAIRTGSRSIANHKFHFSPIFPVDRRIGVAGVSRPCFTFFKPKSLSLLG
jgi:hypothetical protein